MSAEATKPKPESEDGAQRPVVILGIGGGGGTIVARAASGGLYAWDGERLPF